MKDQAHLATDGRFRVEGVSARIAVGYMRRIADCWRVSCSLSGRMGISWPESPKSPSADLGCACPSLL